MAASFRSAFVGATEVATPVAPTRRLIGDVTPTHVFSPWLEVHGPLPARTELVERRGAKIGVSAGSSRSALRRQGENCWGRDPDLRL